MDFAKSPVLNQVVHVLIVGLIPLQFGLHMGILNAPMDYMGCKGVEGSSQDCIPGWDPALPSSIFAVGGLIGSAGTGQLMNKYGAWRVFLLCAGVFIGGSLLVASATSLSHMIVGRIVAGTAAGSSIVVCPILINKLSPPHLRGILGVTTQSTINIGIILAQLMGMLWAESHWRRIMWGAFVISIAAFAGSYYSTLHWRDRVEAGSSPEEASVEEGIDQQSTGNMNASIQELITLPRYRYTLITTVSIFTIQQFTGINSIIQYGVRTLADVSPHAKAINMVISVVNLIVTAVSGPLMDRFSRKLLLLISLGSMGCFTGLLGFGLVRGLPGFSSLAAIFTIGAFALGIGPIPFMYISEVAPREAVSAAQSLGTVSSWVSTFAVLAFFPFFQASMGPSVFYIFSICTLASAAWYAKWLVPDNQ